MTAAAPEAVRAAREAAPGPKALGVFTMLKGLLPRGEWRQARLVFALMLCMALLEAVGVASVMPFVALLGEPDLVTSNRHLAAAYELLGFAEVGSFMLFLGAVVLGLFVASLTLKALTIYAIVRFSTMRLHAIACRLLEAYLRQPYEFFLSRNTADLGKTVLSEVAMVTNGVLVPAMRMLSGIIVATMILALLLVVEPMLSISVAALLGGAYATIYLFARGLLRRIGSERLQANRERFRLANEALAGIKELRLLGQEGSYLERFRRPSEAFARHQATARVVRDLPLYAVQALAFGGVLLLVLFLMSSLGGLEKALPLISLYAFAGYRLMPAFNDIFSNVAHLRFSMPALHLLYDDLVGKERQAAPAAPAGPAAIPFHREIRFEGVSYRYPGGERPALRGIDLTIAAGSSVAFVGSTGAGKSTVADLLLGLLEPTGGRILVDGEPLRPADLRAWQGQLGYVPQAIFLADDTVAANIAFGVPAAQVDRAAVERAARAAHIHDFVVDELPRGYDTVIGERGIRLSGGQRQRLAIARALYRDASVIVFDEATSALDSATEAAVMEAIEELHGRKTIILIAHRLSTVRHCDRLFLLKDGALVRHGTYEELGRSSSEFAQLLVAADGLVATTAR